MTSDEPLDLRTLLTLHEADPGTALLMRHTSEVPSLRRRLPWFAAESPVAYTAYQAFHREHVARMLRTKELLVSTIAVPEGALFTGVYRIGGERTLSQEEWEAVSGHANLRVGGHALPG